MSIMIFFLFLCQLFIAKFRIRFVVVSLPEPKAQNELLWLLIVCHPLSSSRRRLSGKTSIDVN